MRELIDAAAHEPRATRLSEDDRRTIVAYFFRLGEPLQPEHVAYISKQLGISQRSILVVLIEDVFSGEASMRRCACGRLFCAMTDDAQLCVVCELKS